MAEYDTMCLRSARRREGTIALARLAIRKLTDFLKANHLPTRVDSVDANALRRFIIFLGTSPRFKGHPYTHAQDKPLTDAAINGYLSSCGRRSIAGHTNKLSPIRLLPM